MWTQNGRCRVLFAVCAVGLLSWLLPAQIDVAAETQRAARADKSKRTTDPCGKKLGSRGSSDEESDGEGDRNRKRTRLRDCETPSSAGVARGDFNGDGFADLAVGVPFEDEDFVGNVGAVNVIYGSAVGLTSAGDQYLTELTFGYPYTNDDRFGGALASGDFNDDGFSDLAIGMAGRDAFGDTDHGVVLLIDGSAGGLAASTARTLPLIGDRGGEAGAALAWGDFNADGFGDLAVGIPASGIGEAQVFYGSRNSLTLLGAQRIGVSSVERLGAPLAVGDFNGDGASDLVLGIPLDSIEVDFFTIADDAGSVVVVPGSPSGLQTAQRQVLHQNIDVVNGIADDFDMFGFALAVGDFNADLRDDLAVGVPNEDLGTATDSGAVHVFFGGSPFAGQLVDSVNDLFFDQASLGENRESGDHFGRALAAGKFNDDFRADLAIGSPGENVGSISNAGLVSVVYGASAGLSFTSAQHWHENRSDMGDLEAESGDEFGRALSAWNYGKTTHADLAIGVPFEDLFSNNTNSQQVDAGAVVVIYGSAAGLTAAGAHQWHQDRAGIASAASAGDRFGVTLY